MSPPTRGTTGRGLDRNKLNDELWAWIAAVRPENHVDELSLLTHLPGVQRHAAGRNEPHAVVESIRRFLAGVLSEDGCQQNDADQAKIMHGLRIICCTTGARVALSTRMTNANQVLPEWLAAASGDALRKDHHKIAKLRDILTDLVLGDEPSPPSAARAPTEGPSTDTGWSHVEEAVHNCALLAHDLVHALALTSNPTGLRSFDTPARIDVASLALMRLARLFELERHHLGPDADQLGEWLTLPQPDRNVLIVSGFPPTSRRERSLLRAAARRASDGELDPFVAAVEGSAVGREYLKRWLSWLESCQCSSVAAVASTPEEQACQVHRLIEVVHEYWEAAASSAMAASPIHDYQSANSGLT